MRLLRLAFVLVLCTLLGVGAWPGAAAAEEGALVKVDPSEVTVGEGQTAAVSVTVENVKDLYGVEIALRFDPTAVEVVDADANAPGVQVRPGDLLKVDFVARNTVDNDKGEILYVLAQVNPDPPVSGNGTAFTVIFKAKKEGASSPLKITTAKLAAVGGVAIACTSQGGALKVVGAAEAPATPTQAPPPPTPAVLTPTPAPEVTPTKAQPTAAAPASADTPVAPAQSAGQTSAGGSSLPLILGLAVVAVAVAAALFWAVRRARGGAGQG